MSDLYGEFEDSDDLDEGNDDDIGALGSILSWDDDEDHAARTSDPDVAAALAGKSNSVSDVGTSSLPPGLVSFLGGNNNNNNSNKNAANDMQSYFSQFNMGNLLNGNNSNSNNNNNNNGGGNPASTPDLDLSLPGMNFGQQNQQQQQQNPVMNNTINTPVNGSVNGQQQQQQPLVQGQGNQQMLTPQNFALFQQNGMLMQQQQQQNNAKQQQPQQQTLAPAMNGMVMPQVGQQQGQQQQAQPQQQQQQMPPQQQMQQQQQVPQQQVQQQQQVPQQQVQQQQQQVPQQMQQQQVQQQLQQHAAQQFSITGDANAFLRQLQVAQIQQQFNALQQQQQQGGIAQPAINTVQQQAVLQQQLQQLQRTQLPLVAVQPGQQQQQQQAPPVQQVQQQAQPQAQPTASASTPVVAPAAAPTQGLPPKPKPAAKASPAKKSAGSRKKAPPVASASIVVSASDTEGELSSRAAKIGAKRSGGGAESASKKRKPPEPIDTSNMTPAEKAKANRDRNREHAKNTRLRKKAYLEKLKATVDELCKERDTLVSERAGAANLLVEMHNTRTEVLMSFFALRSTNEKRRKLWATILDESCFACVMPVTPYRSFPASEVQVSKCQRTVLGIDGMMADTASLHVLLSSLVDRSKFPYGKIEFCYTLVTEEAVVAGNQIMARWVMSTLNATKLGARMEVSKQGMLCCKFNSAHRITGLELMFDVMALMLQLKQAAGSESFSVIPNTIQTCQRSFDKPMVMTLAEGPYTIVQVNQLWENMTGYAAEEVVGKSSCSVLQGPETDKGGLQELMNEVRFKRAASSMIVNYTKSGEKFRNCIMVFPLSTDSRITHYLALSTYVERIGSDGSAVANTTTAVAAQPTGSVTSSSGFSSANASAAGQMHQMLQSQAQALQGNTNAAAQHQAALANNASAAMLGQSSIVATSGPGQMLPPSGNTMNIQQQQFAVQSAPQQQQQLGVTNGGTPHAQV